MSHAYTSDGFSKEEEEEGEELQSNGSNEANEIPITTNPTMISEGINNNNTKRTRNHRSSKREETPTVDRSTSNSSTNNRDWNFFERSFNRIEVRYLFFCLSFSYGLVIEIHIFGQSLAVYVVLNMFFFLYLFL